MKKWSVVIWALSAAGVAAGLSGVSAKEAEKSPPYIYWNAPAETKPAQGQFDQAPGAPGAPNPQAEEFLRMLREGQGQGRPGTTPPDFEPPETVTPTSRKPGAATGPAKANITKTQDKNGKDLYTVEYRDAEIQDVIQDIAEITGRNFLLDNKVKGTITIISPTPIDADGVWSLFLSALEVRDFTIVETGSHTKIVALGVAASSPLKTYSGAYTPPTENYVTRLYTLENVSATDMVTAIKPLVSKRGDVQSYKQTNTLIITDSGANIRRVIQIIKELDKEGAKEQLEIIKLRHANPTEVTDKIKSIYQQKQDDPTQAASRRIPRPGQTTTPSAQGGEGPLQVSTVLPDDRTNSVIVVATDKAIIKIRELVAQLDLEVKDPRGNIHVYYLQHANADELAAVLVGTATGGTGTTRNKATQASQSISNTGTSNFLSSQGRFGQNTPATTTPGTTGTGTTTGSLGEDIKITSDANTNSLIITASQQDYESLKTVIAQLDIARRQVFVETVIMELGIDQTRQLGISLTGGGDVAGNPIFGGTSFTTLNPLALDAAALAGLSGLSVAGISEKTVTLTLADGTTTTVPAFSAVLQALETATNVNILSTPNILTTDNEEAEIVVGQNVPFVTSSGRDSNNNPIIQVQRQDVAITLRVTPHIKESDFVRMDVFQEITELVPGQDATLVLNQGPTTTKRSADTTVVVKGEQTVVLGGLIDDKMAVSESRVPFLGSIPILGILFRGTSRTMRKSNLLIFLTPYIIDKPEDFQRVLVKKMEERLTFVRRNYGWIQRREIRASLQNHQEKLLKVVEEIDARNEAEKKAQKKHGKKDVQKATTPSDRHIPQSSSRREIHQKDVDVDRLLESY